MRLFTAVDIPPDVIRRLDRLVSELRPTARIAWSPVANLHITTKFIGEWPEARADELIQALRGLSRREPIPIEVHGLGFFPNPRAPRVFWAGVHAPGALGELALETDRALARLGVPSESRAFSPHLTLARIKTPVTLEELHKAIAALASTDCGAFTVDRFFLYRSKLTPSGSIYTKLSEFPFAQ
jgi:2'-5' RNA ligase